MRVLICPDKFAGTLTAVEAAEAIRSGWAAVAPGDELVVRPMADGGTGFLDVVAAAVGGTRIPVPTVDPLGRPVPAAGPGGAAPAHGGSAPACGLHLLGLGGRDPKSTPPSR